MELLAAAALARELSEAGLALYQKIEQALERGKTTIATEDVGNRYDALNDKVQALRGPRK